MTTTATLESPATTTWQIDPAHSHVEFAVRHLMISTVRGRFREFSGSLTGDPSDPATASIAITIDGATIDTRENQRDAHLRSADFLDTERFPALTFTSTRVVPDGDKLNVAGPLTIRGVTRDVTLRVTPEGRAKDPWGNERVGYSATTTISRKDFGLTWNQALETGGVLVGDDVRISIGIQLIRL